MKHLATKILVILVLVGAFLRFFHLSQTLQFLGDQGRDALIARRLLIEHDPVFIGPVTSVGNMYLGPIYYYFMVPFYALTYPSPMGPVYAVALLGTFTIALIYFCGRELVGEKPALTAAFIYTFGWVFISQARFSWNPNPAPFVSMIMIWATYRAWTKNPFYWVVVSICFSVLIQLHYLTLLSLPAAGLIWLWQLIMLLKKKSSVTRFLVSTFISIVIFIISLTPLILFDFRHEFLNAKAFYNITVGSEDQLRSERDTSRVLLETIGRSRHILFETTTIPIWWFNQILVGITLSGLIVLVSKKTPYVRGQIVITIWLLVGIAGTAIYKSTVFDHYIAYLFPVTCLILGMVLAFFWQSRLTKLIVPSFFIWFFVTNLYKYDYRSVSWTVQDMENYSKKILQYTASDEDYSLVGINTYNDIYAMNYRYYLTVWGRKPLDTEDANSAKKLLIINENYEPVQKILDLPIYEIVIFPQKDQRQIVRTPRSPDLIILRR